MLGERAHRCDIAVEKGFGGVRGRLREVRALGRNHELVAQVLLPDGEAAQRDEREDREADDPKDACALRHAARLLDAGVLVYF